MTESEYRDEAVRIRPQLTEIARRYMGDGNEADDMVQDAMLKLWPMHAELRCPMERPACVVVRNLCINRLRRREMTVHLDDGYNIETDCDEGNAERIDRLMAAVDILPDMQQIILRLRHIDGMGMADIARLTGSSETAVRKALSRARQTVRDRFDERRRQ